MKMVAETNDYYPSAITAVNIIYRKFAANGAISGLIDDG
jgi:hypothetical protein